MCINVHKHYMCMCLFCNGQRDAIIPGKRNWVLKSRRDQESQFQLSSLTPYSQSFSKTFWFCVCAHVRVCVHVCVGGRKVDLGICIFRVLWVIITHLKKIKVPGRQKLYPDFAKTHAPSSVSLWEAQSFPDQVSQVTSRGGKLYSRRPLKVPSPTFLRRWCATWPWLPGKAVSPSDVGEGYPHQEINTGLSSQQTWAQRLQLLSTVSSVVGPGVCEPSASPLPQGSPVASSAFLNYKWAAFWLPHWPFLRIPNAILSLWEVFQNGMINHVL